MRCPWQRAHSEVVAAIQMNGFDQSYGMFVSITSGTVKLSADDRLQICLSHWPALLFATICVDNKKFAVLAELQKQQILRTRSLKSAPYADSLTTLCGVQSFALFCFVFFQKVRLPNGRHSSCSISPTVGGTCQKCSIKSPD